jgi:asparagine synthase (glutamine-hydrolysing)
LMAKVDIATMAHGLEARAPLLDHVLLEWAAEIPAEIKLARGVTKALFKSAMAPYLPHQILDRPKRGFGVPLDGWFRNEIKELAHDTLTSSSARQRGLFKPGYVQTLIDEHCQGRADHQNRLWALLMLELWFQMWIDAPTERALLRPAI